MTERIFTIIAISISALSFIFTYMSSLKNKERTDAILCNDLEHFKVDIDAINKKLTGLGDSLDEDRATDTNRYEILSKNITELQTQYKFLKEEVDRMRNKYNFKAQQ
jgi:predicted  nucleic acid-binding Zn-ribbon protein